MGAFLRDADLEAAKKKHQLKKKGWLHTAPLVFASCGVIYGDIGTSPLYVYSSTFTNGVPIETDILGAASLIFWILTLCVVVKYCLIVLWADDSGEGGTFALYSLLCRMAKLTPGNADGLDPEDLKLSRYSSARDVTSKKHKGCSSWVQANLQQLLQTSKAAQQTLLIVVLAMTSMVLGDGVLTPAQSVLGAIYGLQVKKPALSSGVIVGVSCAIIILIFAAQRFGTAKIGFSFSPIVILWFLLNIIISGYNTHMFYPTIYKAISPHYAYRFFAQNRHTGWRELAGIFLAITGAEALYADIGHFSRTAIQISFTCIAYPSLVITYFGQAAWLTAHPDQVGSTFYASIPWGDGFYWFMFTIATAAACIASQAMISAVFTIVTQSMSLGCFPRLTVIHTSKKVTGQIYVPEVNFVMMIATVVVVAIFKTTTKLGFAYGVAVSSMMVGTTFLITLVALTVWQINIFLAVAFLLGFGFIDMVFLTTNLYKVPKGGWFALGMAGIVFALSFIWAWGTRAKHAHLAAHKVKLDDLLRSTMPPLLDRSSMAPNADREPPNTSSEAPGSDSAPPNNSAAAHSTTPVPPIVTPGAEPADASGAAVARVATDTVSDIASEHSSNGSTATITIKGRALVERATGQPILRIPGKALVYCDSAFGLPAIFPTLVSRFGALHRTIILLTVRQVAVPTVLPEERLLVLPLVQEGIVRVVARYGYSDEINHGAEFVATLAAKVQSLLPVSKAGAYEREPIYVLTRPMLVPKAGSNIIRKVLLEAYIVLARFARQPWEGWGIPQAGLFEVGAVLDV
ncbi:hypothetical protein WJX72_002233 [[Myrmecia] bisecta]|uniref:Potassium transporter n=1 Tax=[Myrmecia] bisecta TaxID=41462 RepID=A0AAW1PJH7_9CHLO